MQPDTCHTILAPCDDGRNPLMPHSLLYSPCYVLLWKARSLADKKAHKPPKTAQESPQTAQEPAKTAKESPDETQEGPSYIKQHRCDPNGGSPLKKNKGSADVA